MCEVQVLNQPDPLLNVSKQKMTVKYRKCKYNVGIMSVYNNQKEAVTIEYQIFMKETMSDVSRN